MLNLTAEEFQKMLRESNEKINELSSEFADITLTMGLLSGKKDGIEKKIKDQEGKIAAIQKALILVQGVPPKVSQARNRLLKKMERVGREDITVAENKNLKIEIEGLKVELQKSCSHPFVYDEPGYEGDYLNDYTNRHPGVRYCVVCGFSEQTYESRETGALGLQREYLFKTLVPDEKRIIRDQPWTSEGRKRVCIWIPLGAVLNPFEESVSRALNS